MPSFVHEEENAAPVIIARSSPGHAAGATATPTTAKSPTPSSPSFPATAIDVYDKALAAKLAGRPSVGLLAPLDGNVHTVNGIRSPPGYAPPAPTSPPPPPPPSTTTTATTLPNLLSLVDDPSLYFHRRRRRSSTAFSSYSSDSSSSASSVVSTASSTDMNGHGGHGEDGGDGSSHGGAASSHTTMAPPDDDLRLDGGDVDGDMPLYEADQKHKPLPHLSASSSSVSLAPASPDRPPPPPPPVETTTASSSSNPPSDPAGAESPLPVHTTTHNYNRPEPPSLPPPLPPTPPPKSDAFPRRASKPLPNGGPISVPNPIPDRTRIAVARPSSQTHLTPSSLSRQHQHQNQPHPWINGVDNEEDEEADSVNPDDVQPRNSFASTNASSVRPSSTDNMYTRPVNRGEHVTVHNSLSPGAAVTSPPTGTPINGYTSLGSPGRGGSVASVSPKTTTAANTTVPTTAAPGMDTAGTTSPNSTAAGLSPGQNLHSQPTPHGHSPVPPHRFSSPPAYNPATAAPPGASTTHLAPTGLKHRHTLEVPKPGGPPTRNSREGLDAAGSSGVFASGRFSPTAAGSGSGSIGGRRASLNLVRRNTRSLHSELPRDEVVPDEDALRWAEAYRQKRASKKRRMLEDDDQVIMGTKVDETHSNWVVAYNMLTGIRVSVSRTNAKLDRPLTDEDFHAKQKSTFDIAGNELVPSAKYDFKFKDYAPWVFRHLRSLFHLDPADYLMSLAGKYILSELGSPGKSGSFFYFSRDYKYIIKTIHHSEHKFLRKILKDYYKHVTDNPNTLLSQFFGLHRVKMPYGRKIHFVVMNNLFPPHRDIHQTFDLKGSTVGRDYPEELLSEHPRATMKDLNWLRRHQHLQLGIVKKRLFLEQLHKDVQLLQRLQIMDYSLLVGTHDLHRGNDENLRDKSLQVFDPGRDSNAANSSPYANNNNNNTNTSTYTNANTHAHHANNSSSNVYDNQDSRNHSRDYGDGTDPLPSVLMRTPSKLEHQRKARELRQMLKSERPIPIGQSSNKMPDELDESKQSIFYQDDGGFQATHQNNTSAEEIYYLGVIDCLTHYGIVKKIEHFWKGLSHDRSQISALPPQQYGERFLKFMSGITMSPEDVAQEERARSEAAAAEAAAAADTTGATSTVNAATANASMSPAGSSPPAAVAVPGGATAADGQAADEGASTTTATASGRDKGKVAGHAGGGWTSNLRHRSGASGHDKATDGGAGAAAATNSATAAHRAAEHDALAASPVTPATITHTAVQGSNGNHGTMVLPSLVVGTGGGGSGGSGGVAASSSPAAASNATFGGGHGSERRESTQQPPVLPIVDEAGEGSSTGEPSRESRFSVRTTTTTDTSSDGGGVVGGGGDGSASASGSGGSHNHTGRVTATPPPPTTTTTTTTPPSHTPPSAYLKPESADSGYGVSGTRSRSGTMGTVGSGHKVKMQLSRESLDKALPPLPSLDGAA
ncbi:Phosphatidylinositol-4-phosphate 5-kinase [Niveomyces insectorum RCEF 264]|uniref:1-phosphatidylinositol-4-phosphate 5-kinase n=1 Tax=Niveomyces insectorum RCEF 264 TaxID=1081102 RepID=A0A167XPW6_9HYPO|nr:Phosphatidylinositol-4-phosphate 5-kinase [Niveomyces insectorum RCEF 264]